MFHKFIPLIFRGIVHLILNSKRKFNNRINICIQCMFYFAFVTVHIIEKRILAIVVTGRIHPIRAVRIIDIICSIRRVICSLGNIGSLCSFVFSSELGSQTDSQEVGYFRFQVQTGTEVLKTIAYANAFAISIS